MPKRKKNARARFYVSALGPKQSAEIEAIRLRDTLRAAGHDACVPDRYGYGWTDWTSDRVKLDFALLDAADVVVILGGNGTSLCGHAQCTFDFGYALGRGVEVVYVGAPVWPFQLSPHRHPTIDSFLETLGLPEADPEDFAAEPEPVSSVPFEPTN